MGHLVALAEKAAPHLDHGSEQVLWLDRFEEEIDNLRAALTFCGSSGDGGSLARLGLSVWRFWLFRGHLDEGRRWAELVLQEPSLAQHQRLAAYDPVVFFAYAQGDLSRAQDVAEAWLEAARAARSDIEVGRALHGLALVAHGRGDYEEAARLDEESVRYCGSDPHARYPLHGLGYLAYMAGDLPGARARLEQALRLDEQVGDQDAAAWTVGTLGVVALEGDHDEDAIRLLRACRQIAEDVGNPEPLLRRVVPGLAVVLARRGCDLQAATLLGLMDEATHRGQRIGGPNPIGERLHGIAAAELRSRLDADQLAAACDDGRRLYGQTPLSDILDDAFASVG